MERLTVPGLTRRTILRAWLALPASILLAACGESPALTPTQPVATTPATPTTVAATQPAVVASTAPTSPAATPVQSQPTPTQATTALPPTPACDDGDDPTPAQTAGPYFTANSPERASLLEPGMAGTKIVVTGLVLSTDCQPVARTLLDFWQADDQGVYDNSGFTLRGHQFTDEAGRYRLETIVPGLYPGRTRHFHVKVQAPNRPVLTTQLYFPGEQRNASDGIFSQELLLAVQDAADSKQATFDFVLNVG